MIIEKVAAIKEEAESDRSDENIDIEKELNDFKSKLSIFILNFIFSF